MPVVEVSEETYRRLLEDVARTSEDDDERFREAAGSWSDLDAEQFKQDVYEGRGRKRRRTVDL